MPHEHEVENVTLEAVLTDALGEQFPWAAQSRIESATQLLAKRMADSGVDEHETFTMDMLADALAVGRDMAKIVGPAPSTPSAAAAPAGFIPFGLEPNTRYVYDSMRRHYAAMHDPRHPMFQKFGPALQIEDFTAGYGFGSDPGGITRIVYVGVPTEKTPEGSE